jgi:magnesium chelatase family protein
VHAPGPLLRERWPLSDGAMVRLEQEVHDGRLTRRGSVRVHRVAWSVADVAGIERPGSRELDVALRLRRAEPLSLADMSRPVVRQGSA